MSRTYSTAQINELLTINTLKHRVYLLVVVLVDHDHHLP